jgi:crotonobetainyl-CoA:carnitine CoA-transferase CaiB-like acyl-CoA transferase
MAETTSGGPLPGVRLLDFASVVMAPSAAHTADFLAELAAATPTGRKTA